MSLPADDLTSLSNPLVTVDQLSTSSSRLDGISPGLEDSLRYAGGRLTQSAGILLQLAQPTIAQAIVLFTRFYVGPEGGSFRVNACADTSAAAIYLAAKLSLQPVAPRSVLNVYAYLTSSASPIQGFGFNVRKQPDPEEYHLSEGSYQTAKDTLFQTETILLRAMSFTTQVVTPHHLALTFLQTLGVLPAPPTDRSRALALRTISWLNTALLSPQLLYLTHQPCSLAVAAIYLAAREEGVALPGAVEWWEVFDVDREELGFLTVSFLSCEEWVGREQAKWKVRACPLTVADLEIELEKVGQEEE